MVVREETIMPNPRPRPAINSTNNGKANAQEVSLISAPPVKKNNQKTMKSVNWIASVIRLEITIEIGVTRRGKYTLPNRCALLIKV